MCGIAGITRRMEETEVAEVLSRMAHRGPDGHRAYVSDVCTLIHRRLSIIDLDERALQPMWSAEKDIVLIFNGEIYNYRELRSELEKEYTFATQSDTEVIIYGYKKYGNRIWEKLSGMFAVALLDVHQKKIILARDHAGIKPLFYHFDGQHLAFASEIRSLFGLMHQKPEECLSREMMELYFVLGYIPAPETLYEGISALPRSHMLTFDMETREVVLEPFTTTVGTEADSLKDALMQSVSQHLIADVPVGLFFSGGIDSSLIASMLKERGTDLRTYALSMPGRDADQEYGEKIAEKLGMNVARFAFDQKAFEESYEQVTRHVDLPLADIAMLPTWYISKQAKKEVTVVLSGEGGDELFFGYPRQRVLRRDMPAHALARILAWYRALPQHCGKGVVYLRFAEYIDAASYYIATCSPAFIALDPKAHARMEATMRDMDPLFYDRDLYLENMLLRKLDLITMQHSLEGRVPLLAPELFAFSERERESFKQREDSLLKPALKKVLEEYLPPELIYRKKSGFGFEPGLFTHGSQQVRDDFAQAYAFLKEWHVGPPRVASQEWLLREKPGIVMASILLHRSIINAGF